MTNSTSTVAPEVIVDLTGESDCNDDVMEIMVATEQAKDSHSSKQGDKAKEKKTKRKLHRIGRFLRERTMHLAPRDDSARLRVAQLEWAKEDQRLGTSTSDLMSSTVILCNKDTMLFNTTLTDRGWACGYRNCQMLLSSLIASTDRVSSDTNDDISESTTMGAASRFPRDKAPQTRALQEMLELAWRDGYDRDGAEQLKHRVMGTRKWIGTTEIYCILAHIGVQAHIVDFHKPTAPDGSHPALFSWVVEYFTEATSNGAQDTKPPASSGAVLGCKSTKFVAKHPLYLQHQGHSRTIVGVEMTETATNLLLFDPDINVSADSSDTVRMSRFRFRLRDTRRISQFQILYVDYDFSPSENAEISRFISSTRVP
ncbi:hypothetical protein GGI23_000501 [Coemansia sp. RSA 2559]|nr:hypothetical protein GGI23_000501 [Coemansia sp. RSA 2559]KAJ2869100.1 hypothetical protein GGI22_000465 [Coemansia erecta]